MVQLLLRVGVPLLALVLFVYALVDAIRVPDDSMYRAGTKLIWVLVIVLVPFLVGPLVYLFVGAPRSAPRPPRPSRPPPDDII
jgi:Phospholipase_D-nuclease N-terminal